MKIVSDLGRLYVIKNKNTAKKMMLFIKAIFACRSFRAILCYRIVNYFYNSHHRLLLNFMLVFNSFTQHIEISYKAKIGPGLMIPHPQCVVIGQVEIGNNFTIQQGATLGSNMNKRKNGRAAPIIGDNVLVGAGAKVFGPITIGDNCIIGANSVVSSDIPPDSIVVGVPGKIIGKVKTPYPEMLENIKNNIDMEEL